MCGIRSTSAERSTVEIDQIEGDAASCHTTSRFSLPRRPCIERTGMEQEWNGMMERNGTESRWTEMEWKGDRRRMTHLSCGESKTPGSPFTSTAAVDLLPVHHTWGSGQFDAPLL